MNIAKKYYVDENGNMIGYMRYKNGKEIEKPAEPFHAKLRILMIGWLNSGFNIVLQDENGKMYNMNDVMFKDYISKNDVFIEGDWGFYQQGTSYSIGLQE